MKKLIEFLETNNYILNEPSRYSGFKSKPAFDQDGIRNLVDLVVGDLIGVGPKNLFYIHDGALYAQYFPGESPHTYNSNSKDRLREVNITDFISGDWLATKQRIQYGRPIIVTETNLKEFGKNKIKIEQLLAALKDDVSVSHHYSLVKKYVDEISKLFDERK